MASDVLSDRVSPFIFALIAAIAALVLYQLFRPKRVFEVCPKLPNLPIVGAKPGEWFPYWRALWRNSVDVRRAAKDAYEFKDQACIVPIIDLGKVVVVPPSEMSWFLDQPDSALSTIDHLKDLLQFDWTLTDPRIEDGSRPIHHAMISTKLTRELQNIMPIIAEEVPRSLETGWGTDTDSFKEINLLQDLPYVIGQAVNRIVVGAPTCYNKRLVESAINFAQSLAVSSILIRMLTPMLRPVLAPFLTWSQRKATASFRKELRPEVDRRLQGFRADFDGMKAKHNDFISWIIEDAINSGGPYMLKPTTIIDRALMINFFSIHTSTLALTLVLLDLLSHDFRYIDELRQEIIAALNANDGRFTKRTLACMPKMDSAFFESARMSPTLTIGSGKLITAPEGLTSPSGVHYKYGTYLAVSAYPVYRDPAKYPEPDVYKPFRFAELRDEEKVRGNVASASRHNWTSTGKFVSVFGCGRHSCPGRFYASTSVKIFLSHMLLNYDFEKLQDRPPSWSMGISLIPPLNVKIRFKRREQPLYYTK